MFKPLIIAVDVLAAAPLLAGETGNKVTTSVRGVAVSECPTVATRIRSTSAKCLATGSTVRVYTREEVDRAGAVNIGDALRLLDPIFR
ncbi:MAG: hypothetical protein ABIT36_02580 [Steroidobacteraceae bacterium]